MKSKALQIIKSMLVLLMCLKRMGSNLFVVDFAAKVVETNLKMFFAVEDRS